MNDPLSVEIVRSGVVESVHAVDVAVVEASGAPHASAGDPLRPAAFRSAAKPLQAAACLAAGWRPSSEALAVACASHNAEPAHVKAVDALLAAAGLDRGVLRCPPAPRWNGGADPQPVFHNCSGKHAAMAAAQSALGERPAAYLEPGSAVQQAVRDRVARCAGSAPDGATDGCGAPTFVAPLRAFARAFVANLSDAHGRAAAGAMRARPFLVAGTGRVCTALLDRAVLVKVGAEGIACAAWEGAGLALKVRDGAARARDAALVHSLVTLGVLRHDPGLEGFVAAPVRGGGRTVGALRVTGRIS